jgi:hypothetical protein
MPFRPDANTARVTWARLSLGALMAAVFAETEAVPTGGVLAALCDGTARERLVSRLRGLRRLEADAEGLTWAVLPTEALAAEADARDLDPARWQHRPAGRAHLVDALIESEAAWHAAQPPSPKPASEFVRDYARRYRALAESGCGVGLERCCDGHRACAPVQGGMCSRPMREAHPTLFGGA